MVTGAEPIITLPGESAAPAGELSLEAVRSCSESKT
jgi:hypothetical protein